MRKVEEAEYNKFIEVVSKYMNERIDDFRKDIDDYRKQYSEYLDSILFFYFVLNYISAKKYPCKDDEYVLFTLFNKAALHLLGIYNCLSNGLEIEATIIQRSLYEVYLTVELITEKNVSERAKLFAEFSDVERWSHMQERIKVEPGLQPRDLGLSDEQHKIFQSKYEAIKDNYNIKKPHHWAWKILKDETNGRNPSFLDICKHLGESYVKDYYVSYPVTSKLVHPSEIVTNHYVKIDESTGNRVIVNGPKFTPAIKNTACIAISECAKIAEKILHYFDPENRELRECVQYYAFRICMQE